MIISQANRSLLVPIFMFVSGFCSLAYQVVWLREFRLVFGGSTLAASAVLAIFMGALGLGSWVLGHKADQSSRPGRFYAIIEALIGLSVLISPLLLIYGQKLYYTTGGIQELGWVAVGLQMLIAIAVIATPCFLMGGTLPAAIRLVQTDEDEVRRSSALMYGMNIAGAMLGAFIVNFYCLEILGNTKSLVIAAGLNLVLAAVAVCTVAMHQSPQAASATNSKSPSRARLLYFVAFASGFTFFVLELLWFRSSIPLLGGSVYNFGLILVVVLIGMSLGGLLYSLLLKYIKPSYSLLAIVSTLFALAMAIPYVWGDGFVRLCKVLQAGYMGYPLNDKLWVWFIIAGFLVLPASLMAGIQFPLILSLVGKGKDDVGQQTGRVYAFNTAGAVIGSILGGFILIPQLSINTTWLWMIVATLAVALLLAAVAIFQRAKLGGFTAIAMACLVMLFVAKSSGLTEFWLQNPIGFGRATFVEHESLASVEHEKRMIKQSTLYKYDGRECSGSLSADDDLALLNNGKVDGTALFDAGSQVMLSLLPALLHHDNPENACVIGLGTGMSAGWLAEVESVKTLDVYELEPHIIKCASYYASVNHDATNNPKVNIVLGDARESLLTLKDKNYDVIVSEPSNPQRAGVANLYTQEYYQTVSQRLNEDGVFSQWLQAYEIKLESVHLILATLRSVFPQVCIYETIENDLVFVCFKSRKALAVDTIRSKLNEYPYKLGANRSWGTNSIEGLLAHSVANSDYVSLMAKKLPLINTDDRNLLEFQTARTGGTDRTSPAREILKQSISTGLMVEATDAPISSVRFNYSMAFTARTLGRDPSAWGDVTWFDGTSALNRFKLCEQLLKVVRKKKDYVFESLNAAEEALWARALARAGNARCLEYCEKFKDRMPLDYRIARLEYFWLIDDKNREELEIIDLIKTVKSKVWHLPNFLDVENCLLMINRRIESSPDRLRGKEAELLALLKQPFDTHLMKDARTSLRYTLASRLEAKDMLPVLLDSEPHFPLDDADLLKKRVYVYHKLGHKNLGQAEKDWRLYQKWK